MNVDTNTFGPYRLEALLGRGGMGEVYRAYDVEHQRTVAVKRLAAHLADDPEFQLRFQNEAYNVAQLRSPHVIPIHKFGEIDGQLYIDMRFVEGGDLENLVEATGPLPFDRAVNMLEQIASALDEAHSNGLVHRDVKPSNVLLDSMVADFCYLTDFGITKAAGGGRSRSLTRTGALLGSLPYMAPEQFDGDVTKRTDVYSLTCVFFELITGRKPYDGEGLPALMHSHLKVPPPRPSALNPAAELFDDVVAIGMAKDVNARFETAGELARAARAALEGDPTAPTVPHEMPGAEQAVVEPMPDAMPEAAPMPGIPTVTAPPPADAPPVRGVGQPQPGRPRRWLVPVVAAAAIVAAVVVGVVLGLRGGGTTEAAAPPQAAVPAPTTEPAATTPPPAPVAPGPVVTEAVFTGRSSGNELTIAVGMKDGRAVGYVCDGDSVEAWLEGTVSGNQLTLQDGSGATRVTANVDQRSLLGSITTADAVRPFAAQIATGAAGLYESRRAVQGITTRIGWIVLPDGTQVGIRRQGEVRMPAPPLDVATLSAVDGGETVQVMPVTGESTVILR